METDYYDLIRNNDLESLKTAFAENIDICAVVVYGKSLLINAVVLDRIEVLAFLIRLGCDLNAGDEERGVTALQAAALKNNVKIAEALLAAGAQVDSQDRGGNTPLIEAVFVYEHDTAMAKLLLKYGADPLRRNKAGVSPADLAKTTVKKELIRLFEN